MSVVIYKSEPRAQAMSVSVSVSVTKSIPPRSTSSMSEQIFLCLLIYANAGLPIPYLPCRMPPGNCVHDSLHLIGWCRCGVGAPGLQSREPAQLEIFVRTKMASTPVSGKRKELKNVVHVGVTCRKVDQRAVHSCASDAIMIREGAWNIYATRGHKKTRYPSAGTK
jgi:hypothetical protein